MSEQTEKIPVLFIVGPTASGKTDLAIRIALQQNGEVVSADSRYFYRGMDIGTAKPTLEERRGIPHYLIDVADPDETWSLAMFQKAADEAIRDIHSRGKLPIVVGGTGQYVRAVLEAWTPPEVKPNPRLRLAIEHWGEEIGAEALHQKLAYLDPIAAANIDYQNVRRTIRAFEVIFTCGQCFSEQRGTGESPYAARIIGIHRDRALLYQRIDQRVDHMIENGFVEEVRGLLAKGYSDSLPSLSAIGYREICAHLRGEIGIEEAAQLIKFRTHNYVRRQANWFKATDPAIEWIEGE